MAILLPNAWPCEIYRTTFKNEFHPDGVVKLPFGKDRLDVVLLPPMKDFPLPVGCIKIKAVCNSFAEIWGVDSLGQPCLIANDCPRDNGYVAAKVG